jgi:hypothetical protein
MEDLKEDIDGSFLASLGLSPHSKNRVDPYVSAQEAANLKENQFHP